MAEGRDHDFLGQPTCTPRLKGRLEKQVNGAVFSAVLLCITRFELFMLFMQ